MSDPYITDADVDGGPVSHADALAAEAAGLDAIARDDTIVARDVLRYHRNREREEIGMTTTRETLTAQFTANLPGLPADQIKSCVDFELDGIANAARRKPVWCECGPYIGDGSTEAETASYYRTADGRHGWFHDPAKGGCGGITQTG